MANIPPVDKHFDYQFRVILVGDSMVGKSSIIRCFVHGSFAEQCESTVGVDFSVRSLAIDDDIVVKLQIWDTAGQEKFRSITTSYYRNCVGAIFLFDITNRRSFDHLENWIDESRAHLDSSKVVMRVVGCKLDRGDARQVSFEEAQAFAQMNGAIYMEASAKTGLNVETLFRDLANDVYAKLIKTQDFTNSSNFQGIKMGFNRRQSLLMDNQIPNSSFQLDNSKRDESSNWCCQ